MASRIPPGAGNPLLWWAFLTQLEADLFSSLSVLQAHLCFYPEVMSLHQGCWRECSSFGGKCYSQIYHRVLPKAQNLIPQHDDVTSEWHLHARACTSRKNGSRLVKPEVGQKSLEGPQEMLAGQVSWTGHPNGMMPPKFFIWTERMTLYPRLVLHFLPQHRSVASALSERF